MITVKCKVCGNLFKKYRCKPQVTCSVKCGIIYAGERRKRRTIIVCEICGEKVSVPLSKSNRRFCSNKCRNIGHGFDVSGEKHPSWKGGKTPHHRGHKWGSIRTEMIKIYNNTCQDCGKTLEDKDCHIHHIIPYCHYNTSEEANTPNNLVLLCRSCHTKRERRIKSILPIFMVEHRRIIGDYFYCKKCGKQFWRKPSEIRKGHNIFCSRNCSNTRDIQEQ